MVRGLEMNATRWQVPDSGLADGFFSSSYWTMGERSFSVLDIDGDRQHLCKQQTVVAPVDIYGKTVKDHTGESG